MSDDTPTESFTPGESGDLPTRRERRAAEEAAAAAAKNGQPADGESREGTVSPDPTGEQPTTQLPVAEGTDIFDFGGDDAVEVSDDPANNDPADSAEPDSDEPATPGPMTQLFTPPSQRGPVTEPDPVTEPLSDSALTDDDASTANEIPDAEVDGASTTDDGPATELFTFPGPDAPVPDAVTQRYDQPFDAWPAAHTPADDQATRRFDQPPAAFPGADVFDPLFPAGPQSAQPAAPTQVTESMRRGTPPTEPPQSKRTLIILIVVGAVLLIAVLVLVLLLLTRSIGGGTSASATPSVTKSTSPSPSPSTTPSASPSVTPSPSPTQTTPPAPTNPTFATFSAQSSAGCSSDSGEVALTFTWGSTDATTAYIGVGTTNAKQDPFASNLPPTDTYTDLTYDCTQASQVYTVTLENAAGLITNRTVTISR